jgi:hypothetical protein
VTNVQRPTEGSQQGAAPARDRVATVGVWLAGAAVFFSLFSFALGILLGIAALIVGFVALARRHERHRPAKGLAVLAGAGGVLAIVIGTATAPATPSRASVAAGPAASTAPVALASPAAPAPAATYTFSVAGNGAAGITWPTSSSTIGSANSTTLPWSVAVPISGNLPSYTSLMAHYEDVSNTSSISCTITDQTGRVISRNDSPAGVGSVDCQFGGQNFTATPVTPAPSSPSEGGSDSSSSGGSVDVPYIPHPHLHAHVCVGGKHIHVCS